MNGLSAAGIPVTGMNPGTEPVLKILWERVTGQPGANDP
jgi:hypothetical protein